MISRTATSFPATSCITPFDFQMQKLPRKHMLPRMTDTAVQKYMINIGTEWNNIDVNRSIHITTCETELQQLNYCNLKDREKILHWSQ
jgi:hypothetical protein